MLTIEYTVESEGFRRALKKLPDVLVANLSGAVSRAAIEVGRSAKKHAPKAHTQLTNSIAQERTAVLEFMVGPSVNYGAAVENETEPQRLPNVLSIYDWVRVKRIKPKIEKMDQMDLAWMIAKSIAKKGTESQPYMQPAVEENQNRLMELVNKAVDKTVKKVSA